MPQKKVVKKRPKRKPVKKRLPKKTIHGNGVVGDTVKFFKKHKGKIATGLMLGLIASGTARNGYNAHYRLK